MAYEKQTWNNGDVISADKLNHIEDGIENNRTMTVNDNNRTLDKTWQEIYDVATSGLVIYIKDSSSNYAMVINVLDRDNSYDVEIFNGYGVLSYKASSPSDYPVWQ